MKTDDTIFLLFIIYFYKHSEPFFAEKEHVYRAALGHSPNCSHALKCVFLYVGLHISHISEWKLRWACLLCWFDDVDAGE